MKGKLILCFCFICLLCEVIGLSDCINGFSEEEITGLLTLAQQGDKDAVSRLGDEF